MRKTLLMSWVLLFFSILTYPQGDGEVVVIGRYHVINSKILNEERRILVHLPLGYEDTKLKYPVIYHLYGDFVMTYFADAASVTERLHDAKIMPQVILVGVGNTDRYRDLRPVRRDGKPGGAATFARFFKDELIPFMNTHYRTAGYRILIGPQAGACFGLFALMEHTNLFDAFILENSFANPQNVNEYLLAKAKSFLQARQTLSKFLFMRVRRGSGNFGTAQEQKDIMEARKPAGFRFYYRTTEPEDDFILSTDAKYGLKELFHRYDLPDAVDVNGLEGIKEYYQKFSKKIGFKVNISDRILRDAARKLAQKGLKTQSEKVFKYILELYPRSLDGLFQLAEISISKGDYEAAIHYYKEFLKIRPNEAIIQYKLKNAEKMLRNKGGMDR